MNRASDPGDAHGLAVLLAAALLAAGTALPLMGERGPAFPQPSLARPEGRPEPEAGARADAGPAGTTSRPHPAIPPDINTAGVEALQHLPGIGPTLARRIVADREARGPFRTAEDLLRVPGIGPKRWERIRPLVRRMEEP
jgi:competence ComEA-like helix-hairpin-helix protein